jgi:uncharacterized protein
MPDTALDFDDKDMIGTVIGVDTSRVFIEVANHELVTRMQIGGLLAIQGSTADEYLIGITDRIVRNVESRLSLELETPAGELPMEEVQRDMVRIVMVGTYRTRVGSLTNVFKRGADSFPQIDRKCFLIEAANLQRLMSIFVSNLSPEKRLQLGHYVHDKTAIAVADGDRFFQRHAAIVGSTGSGKSWAVGLILERSSKLEHPNLIVLDMHGEYAPLGEGDAPIALTMRIAGPGDLSVSSSPEDIIFLPYWLLNREEMLSLILERGENAPNQAARFTHHVHKLKEETLEALGKVDVLASFTVDSPIPYDINELLFRLTAEDEEKVEGARAGTEKQGPFYGKLTRLIARLRSRIEDRRNGFMFAPPQSALEYDWLNDLAVKFLRSEQRNGIKVLDFSEVPSDVLPVVVGVFARLLYDVQFWMKSDDRVPVTFVCDEAHLYLPVADEADSIAQRALDTFERIAKEGRKYGVSLLVVSQRPADVSRTILSQCNNFLALRLSNDQDQAVIRRLMPESMAAITDILPLLDIGEALLLGDAVVLPTRVKLDPPTIKPSSATKLFWTEWQLKPSEELSISSGVECLRRQSRI